MGRSRHAARAKNDPEWAAQRRAAAYLAVYLKRGSVQRQACACGATETIALQEDLAHPLRVMWICRPCAATPIDTPTPARTLEAYAARAGGMAAALDRLGSIDPTQLEELADAITRRHRFMNPGSPMHRQAVLRLAIERGLL